MSAEASIPMPPLPGKDPPLQPSFTSTSPAPPTSTSPSLPPAPKMSPPQPQTQTTSANLPLPPQKSDIPPVPRPSFTPFFTLINDPATQSTHHPSRTHYIFSDDDESEVLSAACVHSLHACAGGEDTAALGEMGGLERDVRESETSSSSSATFGQGGERERGKRKGEEEAGRREERVVIVDVNERGDGVVSANSLSSRWQVVSAEIASAPMLNSESVVAGGEEGERGLMLKIEGVGIGEGELMGDSGERAKEKGVGESGVMGEEEMQALMEGFDRKMGLLRKIVASGESWDEARKEKIGGDEESANNA